MSIIRKQIRQQFALQLKGKTLAGQNVFPSRITPNDKDLLPAINIYTVGESVADAGEAPLLNKRELSVICEIIASNPEDDNIAADVCDDIAESIEQIIFKQEGNVKSKLGCLVDKIRLVSVNMEFESNGESAIVSLRLGFVATYMKDAVTSDYDNVTALKGINANWDVGTASDPNPEARDEIDLIQ